MNLSKILLRGLSIAVFMTAFLVSAASCGGESEPTPAAPDPTPTPALSDVLTKAGERMAAMTSAKFGMVDETESGAKFFGTTFKSMEAEVEAPASFRMVVDVVAPAFGFVEIEMLAVGDQAFMKLSKGAPWMSLPLDEVPFNFAGLGPTLRDVLFMIRDGNGAITGQESVQAAVNTTADEKAAVSTAPAESGGEAARATRVSRGECRNLTSGEIIYPGSIR